MSASNRVFDLLAEILVAGGHVCFVVGRSVIKGKVVDNAELIRGAAAGHGMACAANIEREIAPARKSFNLKYGKIKTENILLQRIERVQVIDYDVENSFNTATYLISITL